MKYDDYLDHKIREYNDYDEPEWLEIYRCTSLHMPGDVRTPDEAVSILESIIEDVQDSIDEIKRVTAEPDYDYMLKEQQEAEACYA